MQPSTARITKVDISRPARALAVLRWSDYLLVVVCGFGAAETAVRALVAAASGDAATFVMLTAVAAVLGYAAYTGWRHLSVIDPQVWGSYLWVLLLLACVSVLLALVTVVGWIANGLNPVEGGLQSFLGFVVFLWFAAVAVPGAVFVLLLRRMRIAPMGTPLADLLTDLAARGGPSAEQLTSLPRVNMRRGLTYGFLGVAILVGAQLAPVPMEGRNATTALRGVEQVMIFGFFLLIRARRYFQVSADALLAVDKRAPILFLRSFADDQRLQYANSRNALLDFSLETRLASHFHRFGPFIAVGSPKDTVPQPGAARVLLSDDQWQGRVLEWMKAASIIIMYCGTTGWVNWELRQVVASGRATSLILMFPENKSWRSSRRNRDIAARTEQIREVFRDTPWAEELMEFNDFAGLRAMLFRTDGSMLMINSRSRSRDAYHLAALIAHQQLLNPYLDTQSTSMPVPSPVRRRGVAIAAASAGVVLALLGALYAIGSNSDERLVFKRGELYYRAPVSQAEAQRVGEYLVEEGYFNDQHDTSVQLIKEREIYDVRFVVQPARADDTLVNIVYGAMGREIGRRILGDQPIEVVLVDQQLQPLKAVAPSARLAFGKSELYYTDPITDDEARAVGEQFQQSGFFENDRATSVHLGRGEGAYQLRFVIAEPAKANDRDTVAAFSKLTGIIADTALGAQTVVMHLCDSEFRTLNRERVEHQSVSGGRR
jgi:hypothetical protein